MIEDTVVLFNARGERVELSPYGAAIAAVYVRDRQGRVGDVTVGEGGSAGKIVGRYANRIANGRFAIDGRVYQLATNEGSNTLHGGPDGFAKRIWKTGATRTSIDGSTMSVEFSLTSAAGDQGFPGNLSCNVVYSFDDDAALRITYGAATDEPTVINLTNHVYFNLRDNPTSSIASQQLWIASDEYTPVDRAMIPTGAIVPIAGTARDFRKMRPIGTTAFDTNFVLDAYIGDLRVVAEAFDDESGRRLRVETTEPGLQLYTGKGNAFALETQHFPDSPNHANFPSTALRPGQRFASTTVYRFATSG
ncbi:MAG TPA: aldose epimerase family protein [Candidatus Baltobacteraceae bacterium]|nr:aldose epimerase family protein [Candidatus Baltobacteraceae bacterium]